MLRVSWLSFAIAALLAAAASTSACSADNGQGTGGGKHKGLSSGSGGGTTGSFEGSSATGVPPEDCHSGPNDDADGDGWTPAQGDCNDCDPNVNPGAIELMTPDGGRPTDENCDGMIDDVPASCDQGLPLVDGDPMDAARALGLCQLASADGTRGQPGYAWGVLGAAYVRADGSPLGDPGLQAGIFPSFGWDPSTNSAPVVPQEGYTMLALSSGNARRPGDPDFCVTDSCTSHDGVGAPPGFPETVPGCPGGPDTPINDDVALEVSLRAPTNATGFLFKFRFYSFEFPEYVCSQYNDQFIALMDPAAQGSQNGNISFDSKSNPVSVNIGFFDVCNPNCGEPYTGPMMPNPYCPSGYRDLLGTGFDANPSGNWGGATSWLESQAPVAGGEEFSLRFTIWDAGDHQLDSTVLLDDFEWLATPGVNVSTGEVNNPH